MNNFTINALSGYLIQFLRPFDQICEFNILREVSISWKNSKLQWYYLRGKSATHGQAPKDKNVTM